MLPGALRLSGRFSIGALMIWLERRTDKFLLTPSRESFYASFYARTYSSARDSYFYIRTLEIS